MKFIVNIQNSLIMCQNIIFNETPAVVTYMYNVEFICIPLNQWINLNLKPISVTYWNIPDGFIVNCYFLFVLGVFQLHSNCLKYCIYNIVIVWNI